MTTYRDEMHCFTPLGLTESQVDSDFSVRWLFNGTFLAPKHIMVLNYRKTVEDKSRTTPKEGVFVPSEFNQ
jgi:hypothetical protein